VNKFYMWVDIQDLITCTTFGDDRLRGLGVAMGRISGFSINLIASSLLQHSRSTVRVCEWISTSYRRSIVVRTLVSAGELSLSCARLLAGWVTTLWLSLPQSVSQHGQL